MSPPPPLPLRIVLGAFNDTHAATSILGTSYTPSLDTSRLSAPGLNKDGRVPMEDMKGPFSHFKPRALILSTVRVMAINVSTTLSTFFSDQLHSEQRVESMVQSGEVTEREADEINEKWEEREWRLRKDALPHKIGWAVLRFHAYTALMRLYEYAIARHVLLLDGDGNAASHVVSKGSGCGGGGGDNNSFSNLSHAEAVAIMDRLTRDPYLASLRTSQILRNEEHSPGKVISQKGAETSTSCELTRRMFNSCLWASIISFLAELTIQQGLLIYSYGMYYMAKRKKRREREELRGDHAYKMGVPLAVPFQNDKKEDDDLNESAYILSLMLRSSRLSIVRGMSWIAASAGGALGSVLYPGWGSIFGIQMGDALVGALID